MFNQYPKIIEFVIPKYYRSVDFNGIKYVEEFEAPKVFMPGKYSYDKYNKIYRLLNKVKPQTKEIKKTIYV